MNRENPLKNNLRFATIQAIDLLKNRERISERKASELIFKKIDSGFKADSWKKFYQNIKIFRHRNKPLCNHSKNFLFFERH